jgi:hypothetical protein
VVVVVVVAVVAAVVVVVVLLVVAAVVVVVVLLVREEVGLVAAPAAVVAAAAAAAVVVVVVAVAVVVVVLILTDRRRVGASGSSLLLTNLRSGNNFRTPLCLSSRRRGIKLAARAWLPQSLQSEQRLGRPFGMPPCITSKAAALLNTRWCQRTGCASKRTSRQAPSSAFCSRGVPKSLSKSNPSRCRFFSCACPTCADRAASE